MRIAVPVLLLATCLLVGAGSGVPVAADEAGSDCAICHEEVAEAFRDTAHAMAPGWDAATGCQSCHGSGEEHMESGEPEAIVRPQLLSPRASSDGCLSCHARHEKHFSGRRSIHRLADVGCVACHDPHAVSETLLRGTAIELCSGCHGDVAAQFELPRSHPMGPGGAACASCHEPHATRVLRGGTATGDRTCRQCHFEKAGPFIYNHDTTIVDGCAACHEPHGSTNRHLLRHPSQVNLCYECHSAATTPGWHSAQRFVNEKCTACHSAIHGSNTDQFFLEE